MEIELAKKLEILQQKLRKKDSEILKLQYELHNKDLREYLKTPFTKEDSIIFPLDQKNLHPVIKNSLNFLPTLIPLSQRKSFLPAKELENGEIYHGEWKNGKQDGKGICIFKSWKILLGEKSSFFECYYEGDWKNGLFHGYGRWVEKGGRVKEGMWEECVFKGEMLRLRDFGEVKGV